LVVTVRGRFVGLPPLPPTPTFTCGGPLDEGVVDVVAVLPVLPLLLAAAVLTGTSKIVIVVVDEGEAISLFVALRIGTGRPMFPVAPVNDEVPPNGAKMSRLNGA
jgi:hypothetical protein